MRYRTTSWRPLAGSLLLCAALVASVRADAGLGIAGTEAENVKVGAFEGLPPPQPWRSPAGLTGKVSPGAQGLALPACGMLAGTATLAILGDLSPRGAVGDKYVKAAIEQLNLLKPDLVLTVGNLVEGQTRSGGDYVQQITQVRGMLDGLMMPWLPCIGGREVSSGTRDLADRRFEDLYRRYVGPLYYSVDAGEVQVVALDTEEAGGISDQQVSWLRGELLRMERIGGRGAGGARWIVVTMHRAMWRAGDGGNWGQVRRMLESFNRRPIVTVEGGAGSGMARGARIVAVVAGGERAYAMEPAAEGISYYALGPTGAMPRRGQDAATALRGVLLLKFNGGDSSGDGVSPAIFLLGGESPGKSDGPLLPEDAITGRQRAMFDAIAGWDNDIMGVEGLLDERAATGKQDLRVVMNNPLKETVDVTLRMAGTKFLSSASRREIANTYVESFDLPWELSTSHIIRHLEPGARDGWPVEITRPAEMLRTIDAPPQVEFVVTWGGHEIVLKRKVPVAPLARVTAIAPGQDPWKAAAGGGLFAWELRGDEPRKLNPTWQMAADGQRVFVRVRVDDGTRSYWPGMKLEEGWGGIASDAVSIAWARGQNVERVWILPFAPKGEELRTNRGVGKAQSALLKLDPKSGVTAEVSPFDGGYEATLALPRELLLGKGKDVLMNMTVHDNDGGARTWMRSWAKEAAGPAGWGKFELIEAGNVPK